MPPNGTAEAAPLFPAPPAWPASAPPSVPPPVAEPPASPPPAAAPPASPPPVTAPPASPPPVAAPPLAERPAAPSPVPPASAPVPPDGPPVAAPAAPAQSTQTLFPAAEAPVPVVRPKPRRPIGWIIVVILLFLALAATAWVLMTALQQLKDAQTVIDKQNDLIEDKNTFDSAMQDLVDKAGEFDGTVFGTLVPQDKLYILAARGWNDRWNADGVVKATDDVRALTTDLTAQLAAAAEQAGTNASNTKYEAVIDALGGGFVATAIDNADALCLDDVLGCVTSSDPYTVHIDKADVHAPYMTDFIRQGIAYHEFAHVLQFTNPDATDEPADAFGGNFETMADCFALTYLKGWKLHQTVWINDYQYYEVDVGYGYTCNSKQKAVIRSWYEGLPYELPQITQ